MTSVTLRPSSYIVAFTTKDRWLLDGFIASPISGRGPQNVPEDLLVGVQWKIVRGLEGYFIRSNRPSGWTPVEFNFNRLCWYEIQWDNTAEHWKSVTPVGNPHSIDQLEVV